MIRYPLLEAVNKQWIVALELVASGVLLSGVVASLALGMWGHELMGLGFGIGVLLSLAVALWQSYAFYNLVTCPSCGKQLNRFKNGKKVPRKQAFTQLRSGYGCRHCGWRPSVGA